MLNTDLSDHKNSTSAHSWSSITGKPSTIFVIKTVSKAYSLPLNVGVTVSFTVPTVPGYTPVGVSGFNTGHAFASAAVVNYEIMTLYNTGIEAVTGTASVSILYIKNPL